MENKTTEEMAREALIRVQGHGTRINALEKEVKELKDKIAELLSSPVRPHVHDGLRLK